MAKSRYVRDRADELEPALSLRLEGRAPGFGDGVVPAAALLRALYPAAGDPPTLLHSIEKRIQRGDVKRDRAVRAALDELRQLISVPRLGLEQGEDEKFGAAFLEFSTEHASCMCDSHIYDTKLAGSARVSDCSAASRLRTPLDRETRSDCTNGTNWNESNR